MKDTELERFTSGEGKRKTAFIYFRPDDAFNNILKGEASSRCANDENQKLRCVVCRIKDIDDQIRDEN